MNPYRVTITGADSLVSPIDLLRLSLEFPFVEWGILQSPSRVGTPRYPMNSWVDDLLACARDAVRISKTRFSLHLCGRAAHETAQGSCRQIYYAMAFFERIQINGYVPGEYSGLSRLAHASHRSNDLILQCQSVATLQQCSDDATKIPGAMVLFDPSAGSGRSPLRWPPTPPGCHLGFAGGIKPDNVLDVIKAIGDREPYWIDMESGVRTDDKFDLVKVRSVLEQVATIIHRSQP